MSYGEKMTTKNEHLSAVFDGEATDFEQKRLVDELLKDDDLKQSWSRYALIGDVLREPETTQVAGSDFLANIQQQIEKEESYSQVALKPAANQSTWRKQAGSLALAASIAAISVLGVQSLMNSNTAGQSATTTNVALLKKPVASSNATQKTSTIRLAKNDIAPRQVVDLEQRIKMQRYIVSHIKNASSRTIAPSIRVISYNY